LQRARTALAEQNATILFLTFSSAAQARRWLGETNIEFSILIDAERMVYHAYALRSSLWQAWQPKVWWQYARLLASGRQWRGIQDDSGQLGGDFIIDAQGILRFAYPSQDPTDRPSAQLLLNELTLITRSAT